MATQPILSILVSQKEVLKLIGVRSRETLDRWIRQGLFPPPVRVGGGRLRWVLAEVEAWIEVKKLERSPSSAVPIPAHVNARQTARRSALHAGASQRHD